MIEADCCSISLSSLLRASFETKSNNLLEKTVQLLDCFSHVCVISKDSSATESVFISYFCTLKAIIIFHGDPHDPLNPKSGGHDPQPQTVLRIDASDSGNYERIRCLTNHLPIVPSILGMLWQRTHCSELLVQHCQ